MFSKQCGGHAAALRQQQQQQPGHRAAPQRCRARQRACWLDLSGATAAVACTSPSLCAATTTQHGWAAAAPVNVLQLVPRQQQQQHRRQQRCSRAHAWFKQQEQQPRALWDYRGSSVKQMTLEELQLMHRLSFGHRNQRSYLVVIYRADSPACQALESEVERLASGLRHEPAFAAAALEASGKEAAAFASTLLGIDSVPAVLLYPEAARGCLKFLGPDMSAQGMLAAINKARARAWPATPAGPGAPAWQMVEAAMPLAVSSFRAAAASGSTDAMVASLQQQMQPITPTPLVVQQPVPLWTAGRARFWGALLLASLAFLAWDLRLADAWEDWCLARRQGARARGRRFTAQENLDDVVALMMKGLTGASLLLQPDARRQQGAAGPPQQPQGSDNDGAAQLLEDGEQQQPGQQQEQRQQQQEQQPGQQQPGQPGLGAG